MYTCSFAFLIPPELYETARQIKYQIEEEVENQEAEWREQLSDKNLSENALEDEIAIRKEKYLVKEALFQKIKEHVTKLNDWLIPGEYYLLFIVTDKEKGRERGIAHAVMEFSITPSIYKSYFNLYLKNGKIFDEVFDWNKKGVPVPIHEITDDTILRQVREKSKYAI
jgi:hypothetical protein